MLRRLKASGRSIVFISHFLDDILRISDTVTIFRNGRKIATAPVPPAIDKRWIIERMIGTGHEELEESYTGEIKLDSRPDAPVVLRRRGPDRAGAYRDVSLEVRAGEVLGIYGFMGCGQLELARTLFGKTQARRGHAAHRRQPVPLAQHRAARRAGIAFVPESRRSMLFHHEPVYKNISISILDRISRLLAEARARSGRSRGARSSACSIRPPGRRARCLGTLSGGNQQKVALAKWLTHPPKVLVLSEPTRGMDVGAKDDVVKIVRGLRDEGIGIVVVSTEPETVLSLADRILVMKKGEIVREFAGEAVSKDRLLAAA